MEQNLNNKPIDKAIEKYNLAGQDFYGKINWHLENGWVVSVPYLFAMGYFYKDGKSIVCYIECCVGDMRELLRLNLFKLDSVEFMRDFDGRIKRYDYTKLKRLIK